MARKMLTHDQLHADPNNIRDNVGDVSQLADSIASMGLLQDLVARKNDDGYSLIAGARRHAAIGLLIEDGRWAPDRKIPVEVNNLDDADTRAAMLVENMQRVDLHPVESFRGMLALNSEYGWSAEDIATKIGSTKSFVNKRLKWLKVPDHVLDYHVKGNLTAEHIDNLAKLSVESIEEITADGAIPTAFDIQRAETSAQLDRDYARLVKHAEKRHTVMGRDTFADVVELLDADEEYPRDNPASQFALDIRTKWGTDGFEPVTVGSYLSEIKDLIEELDDLDPTFVVIHRGPYRIDVEVLMSMADAEEAHTPPEPKTAYEKAIDTARTEHQKAVDEYNALIHARRMEYLTTTKASKMLAETAAFIVSTTGSYTCKAAAEVLHIKDVDHENAVERVVEYASKNAVQLAQALAALAMFGMGKRFEPFDVPERPVYEAPNREDYPDDD